MASTYGNDLRLEEIGDGEQSGTWGATTNTNLKLIAEALSFGTEAITTNANTHTTTIADGASDPGRSLYLKYTGTLDSACTITIAPNSISKTWYIENGTSGSQSIIISQGSGANVTIKTGQTKIVYSDGAGSSAAMAEIGTLGVANLAVDTNATVGGNATITGNIDVDGVTNLDAVDIDGAVQLDSTLTVGANDQGYDVTLYGDTAARNATWDSSADSLIFTDNTKAVFGTGSDASVSFDGTDMKVGATAGHLDLFTSEVGSSVRILGSGESLAEFTDDGDVDLFHNGTLKMSTTATGISVAGSVVDNLTRGSIKVGNSSGVFAPLSIGGANTLLQSNGTDAAWATVSGSDSRQNYVADGSITARQAVFLKADGKASAAVSTKYTTRANVGSTGVTPAMNPPSNDDGYSFSTNAYSTVDNVHVSIYLKGGWASGVNNAVCVVSQINADGSITSGSNNNNLFGSSTYRSPCTVEMQYSSTINKFIILYTYKSSSTSHYLRMAIGTLSGNAGAANKTFTLSNQVSIGGENSSQRIQGYYSGGNYGGGLPGAGGSFYFTPDGSNIKGLLHGSYCNANESGYVGTHVVGFTVAANGTLAVGGFVPLTGGGASAGTGWAGYQFEGTFHYHIPTNQWVSLLNAGGAGCYMHMFTQGSGSTTIAQISNDDKINFATAGIVVAEGLSNATMQTVDNTHIYAVLQYGPNKWVYRFTIGSTTLTGGTGNDFTQLKEVDPKTGIAVGGGTSVADWRIFSGFKAYRESGLGFYQGWTQQPGVNYNVTNSGLKKVYYSEFVYTGDNANLGYLRQAEYQQSVNSTEIDSQMINGHGSYDDERDAFFLFGWAGNPASTAFTLNPLVKGVFLAGDIGSGTVPIGIHDSGSTVSNGATASIGMFGSVVEGFSGLPVGGVIKTSSATGRRAVGYAISATKVMVTENNK